MDNYDWYLRNVAHLPYTWQDEVTLMERELARAHAFLKLEEARNRGLVTIQINNPLEKLAETETELTKRFCLKEAIVVRINRFSGKPSLERIGEAGAQYLRQIIPGSRVVGISWGRTLYHLVKNVEPVEVEDLCRSKHGELGQHDQHRTA